MKSVLGIVCIWLLAGQGFAFQPLAYQPAKTYVYEGQSRFSAQIPSLDDSSLAAFSMKYVAKLQYVSENQYFMTITNVRTARVNGDVSESYDDGEMDFHHTPSPEYERALSTPMSVSLQKGVVNRLEVEESDPDWAVNIKKSVAALLQTDLAKVGRPVPIPGENHERHIHPDAELYVVLEDGIWGEVPTKYHVQSIESLDDPNTVGDVLNVTKTKNYRQASDAPLFGYHNFDSQGCPGACQKAQPEIPRSYIRNNPPTWDFGDSDYCSGCPYGFQPDYQPVNVHSVTKYNISGASNKPIIDEIEDEHKIVYELNGNQFVLYTWQSLNLTSIRSTKNQIRLNKPTQLESLAYELPKNDDLKERLELEFMAIYGPVNDDEIQDIVKKVLRSVADDMISDDPASSETLGAKVIEITNAINVLDAEDLNEISQSLEAHDDNRRGKVVRSIWLQSLALAVTNQAAEHAIQLIKEKRVTPFEAVQLLEGLGQNLEKPQAHIIEALLDRVSAGKPAPGQGQLINALAIAIGKLVNQACVDPELNNAWEHSDDDSQPQSRKQQTNPNEQPPQPPRSPKRFARDLTNGTVEQYPCSPKTLSRYVEKVSELLENARSPSKMAIFIESLAHMGTPLVLPHLLPFVNGDAPNMEKLSDEDTSFVSVVATYALHHIAASHPKTILPVAVQQYFDPSQDYDQRIAAFTLLMASQPPLSVLHRVVSELHNEINDNVGYYVYSKLSNVANSTLPCERALAQKVQSVIDHAPEEYANAGLQHSQWFGDDYYDDDNNYGLTWAAAMVANNESVFPRNAYISIEHILGPFRDSVLEAGFTAKGIDTIVDQLTQPGGLLAQIVSPLGSTVDTKNIQGILDLVKAKLKLQGDDEETPRATIFWKLFGRTTYLTLDERNLMSTIESVVNWLRGLNPATGYSGQLTKIWMPSSLFYVLPTAMGLPAVINHRNPIVLNLYVESIHVSTGDKSDSILNTPIAASTVIHPSMHVSSLVYAYAVSPPEDLLYGAGFHRVYEVSTPAVIGIAVDLESDTYALSIKPQLPARILFHKSTPFTFVTAANLISPPKGDLIDDVNEINTIPEPLKYEQRSEAQNWGLAYRVQALSEDPWADIPVSLSSTTSEDGLLAAVLEILKNPEMKPREFHAYVEPHSQEPASQFIFTLDYNRTISNASSPYGVPSSNKLEVDDEDCEDEALFVNYQNVVSHIYGKPYGESQAENTIDDLIHKTKPTWSPALGQDAELVREQTISHVWSATAIVKGSGSRSKHFAGKLDYTHTLDHQGIFVQLHGHKTSSYGPPQKVCASFVAAYPPQPSPFYLEMNSGRSEQANIQANVAWGKHCRDNEIIVRGVLEKTEEQLSSVSVSLETPQGIQTLPWFYHQSQLDRQNGKTVSYACQEAIADSAKLNRVSLEITAQTVSPAMVNFTNAIDLALKHAWYPNMESNPLANNPSDTVSIEIESIDQIEGLPLTNVYVSTPNENVHYTKLYTPYYNPPSALETFEESYMDDLYAGEYSPYCAVMEDYVNTFDNVTFELPDNKCQYLLAQDTQGTPDYVILVSQIDLRAKTKALSISAVGHTVKLLPPIGGKVFPVTVNDKDYKVEIGKQVVSNFGDSNEMLIFARNTVSPHAANVLTYYVKQLDLKIIYDGKNAIVELPRNYQGDNTGLCGDFNDESYMEFSGPDGSTYLQGEDFAASFAIPGQSCPNPPKPTGPSFPPPESQANEQPEDQDEDENQPQSGTSMDTGSRGRSSKQIPSSQKWQTEEDENPTGRTTKSRKPKPSQPRQPSNPRARGQPQPEDEDEEDDAQSQPRQPSRPRARGQPQPEDEDDDTQSQPRQPLNPRARGQFQPQEDEEEENEYPQRQQRQSSNSKARGQPGRGQPQPEPEDEDEEDSPSSPPRNSYRRDQRVKPVGPRVPLIPRNPSQKRWSQAEDEDEEAEQAQRIRNQY